MKRLLLLVRLGLLAMVIGRALLLPTAAPTSVWRSIRGAIPVGFTTACCSA